MAQNAEYLAEAEVHWRANRKGEELLCHRYFDGVLAWSET